MTSTLNGIISVVKMPKLKDRQKQIPGGYQFYLPQLKWKAPGNFPSFTVVANALESVVNANPFLAEKHKWPRDRAGIENWVDLYNATLCARMGWDDYITDGSGGGGVLPKSQPLLHNLNSLAAAAARAKELVAGAKSLMEWDDSGEDAVPRDLSTSRALICSTCPRNEKGDWTEWFTTSAAELIKRRVEKVHARSLSTIHDESLHVCTACHCPLPVKVHVPLSWITKRLTAEQKSRLDPRCWILKETT